MNKEEKALLAERIAQEEKEQEGHRKAALAASRAYDEAVSKEDTAKSEPATETKDDTKSSGTKGKS